MLSSQAKLLSLRTRGLLLARPVSVLGNSLAIGRQHVRLFSTKNDEESDVKVEPTKKRGRPKKVQPVEASTETSAGEEPLAPAKKVVRKRATKSKDEPSVATTTMYVMKFNSPILPYVKFPLT